MKEKTYIAIDLKSFYASVECVERGLDPLRTHLVVADESRTEKTICLAVSPSLKAYGISGRARLFQVVERVREINALRRAAAPGRELKGESADAIELERDKSLALGYLVAPPRMASYIQASTRIYQIYSRYVAPEDIHVYSIDEVFIDASAYLARYGGSAHDFARTIIRQVLAETGITATAGIGSNLYLAKVAMDVWAKKVSADADGVRIAELDELSYRERLWSHRPLTDFWRVGRGYARKLESVGLYTMGDVARCSLGGPGDFHNAALLYQLFGINAELLIDHAWGYEPVEMRHIKAYKPASHSVSVGQVLHRPYAFDEARIVLREMTDGLVMDLTEAGLVTDQVELSLGYDIENLKGDYRGELSEDYYGRRVPKGAHSSQNIPGGHTASRQKLMEAVLALYQRIGDKKLLVRRLTLAAKHLRSAEELAGETRYEQMDLFGEDAAEQEERQRREDRERKRQEAMLAIKNKYGKNAILHGTSYQEGATGRERNRQIGGHKA